jgi:hypothetical protein
MIVEVRTASETSVDNHFTRQYIPEDNSEHHSRRRENLKSQQKHSSSFNNEINSIIISWYFSAVAVSEKKYRAYNPFTRYRTPTANFQGMLWHFMKQLGIFTIPQPGIL